MSKIYDLYGPDQRKIDNLKRRIRGYQKMEKDLNRDIRKTNNKNRELQKRIDTYENPEDLTLMFMYCEEKAKDKIKELQQRIEKAIEINKQIKDFVYNEMVDRGVPGSIELYDLVKEELKILKGGEKDR